MNDIDLLRLLIAESRDDIGLPLPPAAPVNAEEAEEAERVMVQLEAEIGNYAAETYYQCSRERLRHIVTLAINYLDHGSSVLDVGNAPGYMGIALLKAGYRVSGINLSDEWSSTYPDAKWLKEFNVRSTDVELEPLPYPDDSFDAIVFTEVLEHIAITNPRKILDEFHRVLRPKGLVFFSTPNVCNISNISALLSGINIFWQPELFYGSTDRHNREYTPKEVRVLFDSCGFIPNEFYGINDHANWRTGTAAKIYELLGSNHADHSLIRNTIIAVFRRMDAADTSPVLSSPLFE